MLCVLKRKDEIASARAELSSRGLDALSGTVGKLARTLRIVKEVAVGDEIKSWDVLRTVNFIRDNVEKNAAVLDIGAYSSEILPLLVRMGYTSLAGIDLNPALSDMPCADVVQYKVGNFLETTYPDHHFKAVTSISVIEHGYDGERLFREMSRLLAPGGYFVASFDYWPAKTDSSGVRPFGLSWTLFSETDVKEMIAQAAAFGFEPVGALDFTADERPAEWQDRKYTFAWLALRKKLSS